MKHLFVLAALLATPSALAKGDPNIIKEGNKAMVKREACIQYGGHITDTDKRYYMCEGGKYDGYISAGPVSEPEGDEEETGQP